MNDLDYRTATREEKETTPLGPARVRVGYRDSEKGRRKYFEQEAPEGWHVRATTLNGKIVYVMRTSSSSPSDVDENGEKYHVTNIHIFDKGTDPMVIIDYQNYYGDHINAVQMPLDAYLNQLDASDNG